MKRLFLISASVALLFATSASAFEVILRKPPAGGWLKTTVYLENGQTKSYTYKSFKLLRHKTTFKVIAVMQLPQYTAKDIAKICYRPRNEGERCVAVKDKSWGHVWFN